MNWTIVCLALLLAVTTVCTAGSSEESRIYNGKGVASGRYPWIGSLMLMTGEKHLCSVTIVSARWLLTNAHCVPLANNMYRVALGHGEPTIYHIQNIYRHDGFTNNGGEYTHDIALLYTTEQIVFNIHTRPSKLPNHPVPVDVSCWAIGQGIRHDDSTSYVTVGSMDISDQPYVDEPLTESFRYTIPDPLMTIPANGTLIHFDMYMRVPINPSGYFYPYLFRNVDGGTRYSYVGGIRYYPKVSGPQRVNTSITVTKGDTIGMLYYRVGDGRIPFKSRINCEMASLNCSGSYCKNNHYTAFNYHPCREYALRATIKISPSLSDLAPRLEEIKVNVYSSDVEKIIVAGKGATPCEGDDGATLSCNKYEESTVYGIFSYSKGSCNATSSPNAVYTQLYHYRAYIETITGQCL